MKKVIFLLIMILGFTLNAQSLKKYRRGEKLTTAEINAIDTTRTDVVYYAYNTDLGIDIINRRDDQGWVPLVTAGGITDAQIAAGFLNIYPNADTDATDDFSGDYNDLTNKPSNAGNGEFNNVTVGQADGQSGGMMYYHPNTLNAPFGNGNMGVGRTFFNGNNFGFMPPNAQFEGYQFIGTPTEIVDILLPATGTVDLTNIGAGADTNIANTDLTLEGDKIFTVPYSAGADNTFSIVAGNTSVFEIETTDQAELRAKFGALGVTSDDGTKWNSITPIYKSATEPTISPGTDGFFYYNTTTDKIRVAIDGVWEDIAETVGGSENNDAFTGTQLTDGYSFTTADFTSGKKQFWYDGAEDIQITVPGDVAGFGQKLIIWQYGTGKIQVGIDDSLNGISFETIDNLNPVTLTKSFSTFGYRPIGNYGEYVLRGTPLFQDNAATPAPYEVDGFDGITQNNGTGFIRIDDTGATNGEDRIVFVHNDADNTIVDWYINFTAEIGEQYLIEFDAEEIIGTHGSVITRADTGFATQSAINLSGSGMQSYSMTTGEATQISVNIRFGFSSVGDNLNEVALDNLRIKKVE